MPLRLRGVRERIGSRGQRLLHRHQAAGDAAELLAVVGEEVLEVGGDADRGAGEVLLLQRLQRVAVDADEEVVRDDERHEADQRHRAEERPEQARAAGRAFRPEAGLIRTS